MRKWIIIAGIIVAGVCVVICLGAICGHADDPIWYDLPPRKEDDTK